MRQEGNLMNTIGENIATLRKKKGLTQETLAAVIGVSPQSISKWENNTNMPDILLLPVIADVFEVNIDSLFGRQTMGTAGNVEEAFDKCCHTMLEIMGSCIYRSDMGDSFENFMEQYTKSLTVNSKQRTAIIRKHGIVYYRDKIGGLLLKKPQNGWCELINSDESVAVLELLWDDDFRTALAEIIKSKKNVFTISSLCNSCKIENITALEKKFKESKLFVIKTIDIDGKQVAIYELIQGQRLILLFAILAYAIEYNQYESVYIGYDGDSNFCF